MTDKTDIVVKDGHEVELQEWEKQKELLKKTIFPEASDDEFKLLIAIAKSQGLDPLNGEIHGLIFGKNTKNQKVVPIIGINGLRKKAALTGEYGGSDEPEFMYDRANKRLIQAKITIYRITQGHRCPFVGLATLKEFGGTSNIWKTKQRHMLAKCAESQALRKAFPEACSGLYERAEWDKKSKVSEVQKVDDLNEKLGLTESKPVEVAEDVEEN